MGAETGGNAHLDGADEPRRLSFPFVLGLILVPIIFCWFLLRSGYPKNLRILAFLWAAIALAVGYVHATNP